MPRLLTMIRGNEILRVLKSKKGFRAATFGGFFLLGQMLLFVFRLFGFVEAQRNPLRLPPRLS